MTATPATIASIICQAVAELPDRDSPPDWPEAMLVTHDELQQIVANALSAPPAHTVITDLIDLARTVNLALDDSEEMEGDNGRAHVINGQNFDDVCEALARLEALPDDKPGETMGPAQKAEWALRHLPGGS